METENLLLNNLLERGPNLILMLFDVLVIDIFRTRYQQYFNNISCYGKICFHFFFVVVSSTWYYCIIISEPDA